MANFIKRYPKAPWLIDAADLRAQGDPEVQVFTRSMDVLLGLHVRGIEDGGAMIAIRWNGTPVSAVIPDQGLVFDAGED